MVKLSFRAKNLNNILKNIDKYGENKVERINKILESNAEEAAIRAGVILLDNNHYITGTLLRSIKSKVKNRMKYGSSKVFKVYIYSDCHYAIYVERYDPYMFPAAEQQKQVLLAELKSII